MAKQSSRNQNGRLPMKPPDPEVVPTVPGLPREVWINQPAGALSTSDNAH